jgi:flagellar hook-basal body complex protein FliE
MPMRIENLKMFPVKGTLDFQNNKNQPGQEIEKPFSEFLGEALNTVNSLEAKSKQAGIDLAAGKIEDISEVVIAGEKAAIAVQLTTQVRNRVVEAYQEIMRMQV